MAEDKHSETKLKVGELTAREEAGRGIVRIDSNTMNKLGLKEGDVVEINGSKKTAAIAVRAYPADVGLNVIRMDGITRRNSGSGVGETVKIKKAEVKEAKRVTLAPAEKGMIIHISPNLIKQNIYMRPVAKGDVIVPSPVVRRRARGGTIFEEFFGVDFEDFFFTPFSGETKFVVTNSDPGNSIVKITDNTELEILPEMPESMKLDERSVPAVTYEDIGGMSPVIEKVREMIEVPLRHPELFERLGVEAPKGVMLYGPPGTGKTMLAKAVANESGANFISISGPEVISKWYGQSEENLRKIFDEAEKNAPSIIFIDEIDSIAPKREEASGEVERRVVSQLLTLMDGLKKRGKIIIIAATNRPNAIDPALRRPGRFDREIEIPVPDRAGRLEILKIHSRNMPLKDVDLEWLADITYGYVGADLWALAKEAAMSALRRVLPDIKWKEETELPMELMEKLIVIKEDFESALRVVEPSAMREVLVEVPKVKWTDIGGLEDVKATLKEMVEWPLIYPDSFERMGIQPPRGILLYGPPGTGKTMLAKAVANESGANFISVKGPELKSKWVGESEKMIRDLFRRAKQVAPTVVFFDEIDALVPRRGMVTGEHVTESMVSQMLTEMSGLEELKGVVVIAATNRPDMIDPALLRPGRFDRQIMVPSPDEKSRLEILKVHTSHMPLAKDVDLKSIAKSTEFFSGADLEALAREAAMSALRENIKSKEVKMKNFNDALKKAVPSISKEVRAHYENFIERQKKVKKAEEESMPAYIG